MPELRAWWWRTLYAVCFGPVTQRVAGAMLRIYAGLRSRAATEGVIGFIDRRYTYSGWPFYGRGWTNLHVSRFTSGLRAALQPRPLRPVRRPPRPLKRIACVGRFAGLLGFPKELMERCPIELVVADIGYEGQQAPYLEPVARAYRAFDLHRDGEIDRLARFVNESAPDLVMSIGHKPEVYDILDRLDAPCLTNYCAGSDLIHHDALDIQFHGQPEADYFVRGRRMFCGTTRAPFSNGFIHTITGYIDPRGLLGAPRKPWRGRRPLIVCHGSLFKYAAPEFLDVVFHWLKNEPATELVLMGRDYQGALDSIRRQAEAAGMSGRVRYEGHFSAVRDDEGNVSAAGWKALLEWLADARLAPNPFPLGGGSARYEAYAMGVPAPHLGVRFDPASWARPQPSICEIPSMLVPRGTASSLDEYRALGLRCLRDETFADALAADQLAVARSITDADRWWREIVEGHEQWLQWIAGGRQFASEAR